MGSTIDKGNERVWGLKTEKRLYPSKNEKWRKIGKTLGGRWGWFGNLIGDVWVRFILYTNHFKLFYFSHFLKQSI
jgi:hypothetical protein